MNSFKTAKGTELPLLDMRGKPYLQVAHRLIWFREEKPLWGIETLLITRDEKHTVAKAIIRDEAGRIVATAHKFEDKQGFGDHTEKAETGAIGRALALIGYGTQFVGDELSEGSRLADSPTTPGNRVPMKMEQPSFDDGIPSTTYHCSFGKYKGRTVDQVANEFGLKEMGDYVTYLEDSAQKKGEKIQGRVKELIDAFSDYIGSFETAQERDVP